MGAGDVVVQIIDMPTTEAAIDTIVTAMRVIAGASAKWMMSALNDQLVVVAIEE